MMTPTVISISGLSSNVGKTTLVCRLLEAFPGWEAIKISRGHYRSCGKDAEACCVSPLLGEHPRIRSGREATYARGKDSGRYWDSGAADVHWLICTNEQVEAGALEVIQRVKSPGVFVEGTSFIKYVPVDYAVMVARAPFDDVKSSAVKALSTVNSIFISGADADCEIASVFQRKIGKRGVTPRDWDYYLDDDVERLVKRIRSIHSARCGSLPIIGNLP